MHLAHYKGTETMANEELSTIGLFTKKGEHYMFHQTIQWKGQRSGDDFETHVKKITYGRWEVYTKSPKRKAAANLVHIRKMFNDFKEAFDFGLEVADNTHKYIKVIPKG